MSQVTKRALEASLKNLLLQKPLSKITISDITEDCGINRMTFYYHFKDIYDLVEWSCQEDASKALAGNKTYETWQQGFLQLFKAVQDNKPFIMNVYHSVSREQVENYLYKVTYDLLEGVVEEQAQGMSVRDEDKAFIATVYKYAFVGLMLDWIKGDMKGDPHLIVERLDQFVHDNMGWHFDKFIPLVGAIFALSIGCNLISVVGLWSPTADLNTEAAWAIVVFIIIMYYKIKTNGILAYLKGLLDPIFLMAPINVLSEVSTPVSMAFRHFGNILSGTVISTLLYWALASLSHVIFGWLPGFLSQIQLFQIGIPAFTGLYFDWFGGCIQAFIFCTLTTIFIKRAAGED